MIITKTPFRITLGGGGTDLPYWYKGHGSTFISAAIDKYIYISLYRTPFFEGIHLKYSKTETVEKVEDIEHDIIRATLKEHGPKKAVEIVSHADIPAGTGLGSSGSFGVGLLKAIRPSKNARPLAEESTRIQMDILKHPIGVQDQYVAAYGGVNVYKVSKTGLIEIEPLYAGPIARSMDYLGMLENKLCMFYTGTTRSANKILSESTESGLQHIQKLGHASLDALEKAEFHRFGEIMNEHWMYKKKRHGDMSNVEIDTFYELALKNGAVGGKLIGAGGGGFLLFYTEDREKLIDAMPLKHVPFKFEMKGSQVI